MILPRILRVALQSVMIKQNPTQSGYIILMSVLVIGAVGTAVSTSLLLLGVGSALTSLDQQRTTQARALANACAEEALERLRLDTGYNGGETITFDTGTCSLGVIGGSGDTNRTIEATGNVDSVVRRVYVEVASVGPPTDLTSWQEVDDF